MANATELKSKFTDLLKSMFQLDQPELDFGLYRIMHAKADRINHFLDKELAQQIDAVFADADQADQNQAIEAAKQKLVSQLGYGAFDENGKLAEHFKEVPAAKEYLAAVEQAKSGKGNLSERAVIYDHLIRFFKRYYDGGDFMSRRYHVAENKSRAAAYAVPYDGSEVYLHWANKDQYYIKTTESFTLYSFDIAEAAKKHSEASRQSSKGGLLDLDEPTPLANKRIHFKLVDAAQGEHNNNKESEKRQFFIRTENPVALNDEGELEVYFEFRVATKADNISAEQEKQLKSRFGASNKGDLPNLYITQVIQDALSEMQPQSGIEDFVAFAQIQAPTDKVKQRPLITKYINNYTSKNTMDYFIHKDLGGFLQRELDFYIKNEIMRLDDMEQADDANYARLLKQIKALRGVAKDIIAFLAQLENFQKRLWLKSKFIVESQYCLTLDRLGKHPSLLKEVLTNDEQKQEWIKLFDIDISELEDCFESGIEILLSHDKFRYLVLDTKFFTVEFKERLLSEIECSDDRINGVLINSENFQFLRILASKYSKSVDTIYIDPPYNTAASEILYKNSYKHSSWLSLMEMRYVSAKTLMGDKGIISTAIDDAEFHRLEAQKSQIFGAQNHLGTLAIMHNPKGRDQRYLATSHEYTLIFAADKSKAVMNKLKLSDKQISEKYPKINSDGKRYRELPLRRSGSAPSRKDRPYMYFPFLLNRKNSLIEIVPEHEYREIYKGNVFDDEYVEQLRLKYDALGYDFILPIREDGSLGRWRWGYERVKNEVGNNVFTVIGQDNPTIYARDFADSKFLPKSLWFDSRHDASTKGTNLLKNIIPNNPFDYPKSIFSVLDILSITSGSNSVILDYFAGSGTTGHAVVNLNREEQSDRKYILCEMGAHFDTVLKPRIQRIVYAKNWKGGKPIFDSEGKAGGISQCFKYLRLEQYEDTLNNLVGSRAYNPDAVPKDFMLSYLLDAETAESPSLLNLEQFSQPRNYKLQIKKPNSDQSSPQLIDLVETFNWLIGVHVEKLDKWRAYDCQFEREHDPELPQDQNTRLKVTKMKETSAYTDDAPVFQVRTVEGWVRQIPGNDELRDKVLVIWRNLSDDAEEDSAFLEALLEKWKINQADGEFDKIYINGPHGLQLRGSAKTRLLSLEDTFMTKMWEDA